MTLRKFPKVGPKVSIARKALPALLVYVEVVHSQDKLISFHNSPSSIPALSGLTLAGSRPLPKVRPHFILADASFILFQCL